MVRVSPIFVFAALLACERAATPVPDPVSESPAAPAEVASGAPTPAATPAVAADDGPIGVDACDRYVDSYRRCIAEVVPAEERAIHGEVLDGQRLAWSRARADEKLAAGLADACAAATTAARLAVPRCKHW
ncbi:hypothetical protein [Nannocystis punicea]|uniref:Lysozyme inhibitor LprI N-terminal domain-containing protein n=1 Tax=Nannocystis punicea TaxID=2995304 RepID=A0ABY7H2S4_9BACT|nr:hypothetical protein [Nannocystis poenicansa]WAS93537.1 hypothetical protein O0S08_45980 [Nannocystis poenicansa]